MGYIIVAFIGIGVPLTQHCLSYHIRLQLCLLNKECLFNKRKVWPTKIKNIVAITMWRRKKKSSHFEKFTEIHFKVLSYATKRCNKMLLIKISGVTVEGYSRWYYKIFDSYIYSSLSSACELWLLISFRPKQPKWILRDALLHEKKHYIFRDRKLNPATIKILSHNSIQERQ